MKKCRQCKETLTKAELKLVKRGRGFLCNECHKINTKRYADKRAKAIKEYKGWV